MKKQSSNGTSLTETPVARDREPAPVHYLDADSVIRRFSRVDALADGDLVNASRLASEAGFRYPVALNSAAWQACVAVSASDLIHNQTGRLWDVLNVLRFSISPGCGSEILFCVTVCDEHENTRKVELRAVCGPGDDFEPVITIMLPDED